MPIIEVNHVTKEYKLGQLASLKQTALNSLNRLTGRPAEERKPFKALDDVTFLVEQGEVVGMIPNHPLGMNQAMTINHPFAKGGQGDLNCTLIQKSPSSPSQALPLLQSGKRVGFSNGLFGIIGANWAGKSNENWCPH